MYDKYEYKIMDLNNKTLNILCRAEYNPENSYDTNYYFFDNDSWYKDFIDLHKLEPEDTTLKDDFEDFVTNVHDFMVHGDMMDELKSIEDNQTIEKDEYKIIITATKI